MTGLYPHTRGHRTIHHLLHRERGENNLLKTLKDAGYFVFWAGKNDLIDGDDDFAQHCDVLFRPAPDDFARWGLTPRHELHTDIQARRGSTTDDTYYSFHGGRLDRGRDPVYANADWPRIFAAEEFIREYRGERPLCVFLSLQYPHPPYMVEDPWHSIIDRSRLRPRVPEPASLADLPRMMRGLLEEQRLRGWSEDRWTELRATYLGMCARVDDQFGRICEALRSRGIYDDTGIFFFSDHGDYTGDYGLVEKAQNLFHDCLTRVPFLIRPPRQEPFRPGVRDTLVELVDFTATVCAMAGVDLGHRQFGRSLLSALADAGHVHREAVFCEGGRLPGEPEASERESVPATGAETGLYWPRMKLQLSEEPFYHGKGVMVRTGTHKFVRRPFEQDELYDLRDDPRELHNRINDPGIDSVRRDLEQRLLTWMITTADVVPTRADRRDPIHGIPAPKLAH